MPYKDKKKQLAYQRKWYRDNYPKPTEKRVAANKKWKAEHPDKVREYDSKYRRRKRKEYEENGLCNRCGNKIDEDERMLYNSNRCIVCRTIHTIQERHLRNKIKYQRQY